MHLEADRGARDRVALGVAVASEPTSGLVLPDSMTRVLQTIVETTTGPDGAFDVGEQPAATFDEDVARDPPRPRVGRAGTFVMDNVRF